MDKIEGEQPNCHFTINKGEAEQPNCYFTINEGDAGDAVLSRYFFKPQVTKKK
jgi:hypothetical protein